MLRVGGRLQKAALTFEVKHQIVLPKSHVTEQKMANLPKVCYFCSTLHILWYGRFWPLAH